MVLTFGWESIRVIAAEPNLRDMMSEMYEELGRFREISPIVPDFARMMHMEDLGIFQVWAARTEHGLLAGWIELHICPHIHCATTLWAFDSGHYLSPAFRGNGFAWVRMWRTAMAALKERGVKLLAAHDNAQRPLDVVFRRLGAEVTGTLYAMVL